MNLLIQKLVFHNGSRFNQYLFAVILTIPLLSFGMIQGWLSPMLASLKSPNGPSRTPFTSNDISWMTSVTYITAIVLGAPLGYLTDRFGRKIMSLITIFSLVLYWSIKLCSLEPWALITARAVAGFPCSACYIVLPIYLKEISDKEIRGALGSLIILGRNIGYLSSYVGADLLNVRVMLWLGFAVPAFVFLVFLAMPETPEFLIKEGKVNEARAVLAWLRGRSVCDRELQLEVDALVHRAKQSHAEPQSAWSAILRDPTTLKAFIITIVIKIAQQFDGYLIVLIYAGFVFEQASASSTMHLSPNKQVMVVGAVQLFGSIFATTLVEKTGRKMLLVSTSFVVGVGMLLLSAWFYLTAAGVWLPGWIPVIAMCTCIFADAAGFQPISYIIITDMFTFQPIYVPLLGTGLLSEREGLGCSSHAGPVRIGNFTHTIELLRAGFLTMFSFTEKLMLRGTVSTFANIMSKAANFIQMKWFHKLNLVIGIHWTFFFFAAVCFFASFYALVFFPETKQKSVEEIYSQLAGKKKNKSNSNA